MKFKNVIGYTFMAFFLLLSSCNSEEAIPLDSIEKTSTQETVCGEATTVSLIAGQHIDVGTVTVSNDETNLYVTYETSGDWYLTETHVYVGEESDIPLNGGGNPKIGHFYSEDHGNVSTYTYSFDLANLSDSFVVVAHAVVDSPTNKSETAFGCGDKEFPGKRWGCYFDYEKQECEEEDDCLDVFARKYEDNLTSCIDYPVMNNYYQGWSSNFSYNILFDSQVRTMDIYKNNDNCDISNAATIGRVEMVQSDTNEIEVSYIIFNSEYGGDAPGSVNIYGVSKVNFYIGAEENPYNSDGTLKAGIDASNFYEETLDSSIKRPDSFTMTWTGNTDPSTNIYVIAYAEVCEIGD